jgi:myo-inositol 2-dehydrogenase / D-chiro-inositol 1-dehydrogenase
VSRRTFLSHCAAVAAATGLPRWFVEKELSASTQGAVRPGANDRPGIALIACGGMGRVASRFGDVVAVCDVDGRCSVGGRCRGRRLAARDIGGLLQEPLDG